MQIVNPSSARAAWYDRNPGGKTENYSAEGVAPHALTVRWTYTVPTAKKFICESAFVSLLRNTASTTQGAASAEVDYVPASGFTVSLLTVVDSSQSVFAGESNDVGTQVFGFPGDAFEGATADQSIGGSLNYSVEMKGTEFDA